MDKLTILNRALSTTGNPTLNVLNDGSVEWDKANLAFERAIEDLISRHNWPFAKVTADLVLSADNPSKRYDHAFEMPDDVVHLGAVLVGGERTLSYEVIGRYVCLDEDSDVAIEGYAAPDDEVWHPQASTILTLYVEAGLFDALNDDYSESRVRKLEAEGRLLEARPRIDRQNPAQNAYVSRIAQARRTRRNDQSAA